jgi:FkbM family methyltransferase
MKGILIQQFYVFSAILRLINSKIWSLKLSKYDTITVIKGKKFKFTRYGEIAKQLYSIQHLVSINKGFEFNTISKYTNLLFKGANVLDIGANVGLFSLLGSELVGDKGRIWAFEPSKKTYDALVENLKLNNCYNVEAFQYAVSDREGFVNLTKPEGNEDAYNHMQFDTEGNPVNIGVDTVKMIRVDDFLSHKGITKIDVIKIDVEGAEYLSLTGADKLFRSGVLPTIIFECYEPWCKRFDKCVFDTLSYLSQFGYTFEQYEDYQWVAIPKK